METTRHKGALARAFGSWEFFKLWVAQVISATGDWLGLVAIIALTADISKSNDGAAISLVLLTRVVPGLLFTPAAGVIVDRFDRKRLLISCDIGRALVVLTLPFVDSLLGLVLASLCLELLTMMWSPAKEAVVPSLVPADRLTTANSLNVAAAYGMFPVAAGLAAVLAKLAEKFPRDGWVSSLHLNDTGLALYADALTFLATAAIISTVAIPAAASRPRIKEKLGVGAALRDMAEGFKFIAVNPVVRAVNIGLVTGIIGGGMLIPLGFLFVQDVVAKRRIDVDADFNLVLFSLGLGMAIGVLAASLLQNHINRARVFTIALFAAGTSLLVAASAAVLPVVAPAVGFLGFSAGPVYVIGFTLLHENTSDELRGRVFSGLLGLVRMCLLLALGVAPLLASLLDQLSERAFGGALDFWGISVEIPGVRLTLWLAGLIIIAAGGLASWSLRSLEPEIVSEAP